MNPDLLSQLTALIQDQQNTINTQDSTIHLLLNILGNNPEGEVTDRTDIEYYLAQLGAYFAIKVRNNQDDKTCAELYVAVNKIRSYINELHHSDLDDGK